MTQRVLIGFADALAAIESAWCLADHGFEVYAFARSGTRPPLRHCRGVRIIEITPPEQDASASRSELSHVMQELHPAVLLPLDDHAIWLEDQLSWSTSAEDAARHTVGQAVIAGPVGRLAELALDKRLQLEAAKSAGFALPPSWHEVDGQLPGSGPWIVKPAMAVELVDGRLRRETGKIASTPAEVQAAAATIGETAVIQALIEGVGEGIFGLATPDGVKALSAHQRIRMMNPKGSGSSACRSIPVDEMLVDPVRNFIEATSWRGLFMIELLRNAAGTPWFMELNGRTWGSMALACRRGFAYPAWAVQAALDQGSVPEPPASARHLTARNLGREIVHLGAVLAYNGAPRLKTVRDVMTLRRGECWYNWRRGDAYVFAADAWATVRAQVRGRGRASR